MAWENLVTEDEAEKKIDEWNDGLLNQIKEITNTNIFDDFHDLLLDAGALDGMMVFKDEPDGHEWYNTNETFPEVYIDELGGGGYIYAKFMKGKWLMIPYSS